MSRGKLWLAFEALERPEQVAALREMASSIGCSLKDHRSKKAEVMTKVRPKKVSKPTLEGQTTDPEPTGMAGAIVNSSKVAAKKRQKKPKVSKDIPEQDIEAVVRALNSAVAKHVSSEISYDSRDREHTAAIRKRLAKYPMADLLAVIEWWPTRQPFKAFHPLRCFTPGTLFGDTFPENVGKAKGWKATGRDDVEYDSDALWRETLARGDT